VAPGKYGLAAGRSGFPPARAALRRAGRAVPARRRRGSGTGSGPRGIVARMAWREAAGWLAHAHAWADPRDLALRDLGLTGSYTIATMVGRAVRDLPNTYARRATRPWEDQDTDGLMAGDPAVATALTFARVLQRLARTRDNPFANLETASATVNQFGGDMLDGICFAHWRGETVGLVGAASGAAGGAG